MDSFFIDPFFRYPTEPSELAVRRQEILEALSKVIPREIIFEDQAAFAAWLNKTVPFVKWHEESANPCSLKIFLLCTSSREMNVGYFFQNLVSKELVNFRKISGVSFRQMEFYIEKDTLERFFITEAAVVIEDPHERQRIKESFGTFIEEVRLGLSCASYAYDILNAKPFLNDQKIQLILKRLVRAKSKYLKHIDEGIFLELDRFLILTEKDFRARRSTEHLVRVISSLHLFKKQMLKALSSNPHKRHLYVRLLPTNIQFTFGSKRVLGLVISVYLRDSQELFSEKHVVQAIQSYIPQAQAIQDSFYVAQNGREMIHSIYIELEKKGGEPFGLGDIRLLKKEVADELKRRIERLTSAIFIVPNDEEILKDILILSQELKKPTDTPQMILRFEEQTFSHLVFLVTLVQIIKKHQLNDSLEDIELAEGRLVLSRSQIVGWMDETYVKQAKAFRLHLLKDPSFLRSDFSLSLPLARQRAAFVMRKLFGEVRDFTGELFSLQGKRLLELKQSLSDSSQKEQELLEEFFYSLTPIDAQFVLPITFLKTLFLDFLKAFNQDLHKKETHYLKLQHCEGRAYALLKVREFSIKENIPRSFDKHQIFLKEIVTASFYHQDALYLMYIYNDFNENKQRKFHEAVEEGVVEWKKIFLSKRVVRLGFSTLGSILDPRLKGALGELNIAKMLFEGLTRIGSDGKAKLSIAESVDIAQDQRSYLFRLRDSKWSYEAPLTAYDFEYAWKSVLVPSFKTPFSYLFYSIKNAKLAKEGQVEIAEVGIKALDERTLRVEFEFPTPYFLELAANPLYSPINRAIDQSCPDWAIRSGDSYICNGPFHLVERDSFNRYILNRNPLYWDVNNVQLDQLILHKVTSSEALEMFNADEGHWESRSTRSLKTFFTEKGLEQVYCHPFSRVFWLSFNCSRFPFRHAKLRKAFACAINRKDIVEILPEGIIPAKTPLPFQHSFYQEVENYEENGANARILFEEALREIGLTKNHFPPLILSCTASAFREKLMGMIKRQWQQVLGVYCRIESLSWQTFFEKMTQGDYQIGGITWGPLIDDPIYTLDVFKSSKEPVNFSKWQNVDYRSILDGAQQELDPKLRNYHLARAERILMEEVPIVPIYYEKENFIQKFHLVEADKESPSKPLAIYLQE